jgi:hypothetical protein
MAAQHWFRLHSGRAGLNPQRLEGDLAQGDLMELSAWTAGPTGSWRDNASARGPTLSTADRHCGLAASLPSKLVAKVPDCPLHEPHKNPTSPRPGPPPQDPHGHDDIPRHTSALMLK